MGLLDSVAGAVLGKMMGGNKGLMAQVAMDMFTKSGGLDGILKKFQDGGLSDLASSWTSKDSNMPVSSSQIASVLGSGAIADMASKFGISSDDLSSQIAEHLPSVIDQMTPDGEVKSDSGDLLESVLGMLK